MKNVFMMTGTAHESVNVQDVRYLSLRAVA